MLIVRNIPDLRQRHAVQAVMPVSAIHLLRATIAGLGPPSSLRIDSVFTP
jgi:hypothetical protein